MDSGQLDTRIRFDRPVADASFDGAGSGTWVPVKTVWASVLDILPSRGEKLAEGVTITNRPARIRIRHRSGITGDMRIAIGALSAPDEPQPEGRRYLRIISPPATIGRREWMEMMAEEVSPAGNGA